MIYLTKYQDKKIGIFGLGKTGISVFQTLEQFTKMLVCYDDKAKSGENFLDLDGTYIKDLNDPVWTNLDYLVISPGITHDHQIFTLARQYSIEVCCDIELLYNQHPRAQYIAITGTNGKSTTTSLLGHLLSSPLGFVIGGNLGVPCLTLPDQAAGYILELSSFQLELLKNFKANISILLNIAAHHLDRYATLAEYISAKMQIFKNCDQYSVAIIGIDDEYTAKIYHTLSKSPVGRIIPISIKRILTRGISIQDSILYDHLEAPLHLPLSIPNSLKGEHNLQNIAAAYIVSKILGISAHDFSKNLANFKGLEHRMQFVGNLGKLACYNDSKATNPTAASKSIASLQDIYLLVGGILKANDLSPLIPSTANVKRAYIYGTDRLVLQQFFSQYLPCAVFDDLAQAFNAALADYQTQLDEANLLLAPACSSLDQFANFEERGNYFINLVKDAQRNYA